MKDTTYLQHALKSVIVRTCCFFSNESLEQIQKEQYSLQDIQILEELGYNVTIATCFNEIPWGCDLYFSWWASGSFLPLIKAKLSGRPIIVVAGGNESTFYRDSVTHTPRGYLATSWYKKIATRLTLKFSTAVLCVSSFMSKDVKKLGAINPMTVYNSVNVQKFNLLNSSRKFVTSIFRLDEDVVQIKRGEIFVRSIPYVLQSYPEQEFIVIGEKGNAYERLKELSLKLSIENKIRFIGNMNNEEVAKWLQQSKVYVQISDTETFGVAIAEAMSCGTLIVVSKQGAIPEVAGNLGVYVDHNDPKSVADGIIDVLNKSSNEYNELSIRTRDRILKNFSFDLRKKAIQEIISNL